MRLAAEDQNIRFDKEKASLRSRNEEQMNMLAQRASQGQQYKDKLEEREVEFEKIEAEYEEKVQELEKYLREVKSDLDLRKRENENLKSEN